MLLEVGAGASGFLMLLLKVSVVFAVAWLLAVTSRRTSAAVRHGIWTLASLAVLALPWVDRWVPPLHLDLPVLTELIASTPSPSVQGRPSPATMTRGAIPPVSGQVERAGTQPSAAVASEPAGDSPLRIPWSSILLVAWAGGAVLRLAWLGFLFVRAHQLTRRARPIADESRELLAETLRSELGIRRPVRLLRNSVISMPVAWGVFRPVVILPDDAAEWPADRLRVVLLHELAHIRRWDYLTSLVTEVACALYWPVPLVWLVRRRARIEQERACDDRVLATGTRALEYAEHLLAIARAFYGDRVDLGLGVAVAREASLKHRIRAILDVDVDRRPMRSVRGIALAAVLLSIALFVASARVAQPAEASGLANSGRRIASIADGAPVFLWFEAENGSVSGRARRDESLDASGAAFVVLERRGTAGADAGGGHVEYTFETPAGEYRLWARVGPASSSEAVLSVSLDGGASVPWHVRVEHGWEWREIPRASDAVSGRGSTPLSEGEHALSISALSGEMSIDRLLVTSDPTFVPTRRGPSAGLRRSYQLIEAESASEIAGRLRSPEDARASGGEYLVFSGRRRGNPDGRARYSFEVPEGGRYIVWGRVSARDRESNSLFVSMNGGPELIWDVSERGRDDLAWVWDPINSRTEGGCIDPLVLELPAGVNVLELRSRRGGVRLDAMLITNDLNRRPRGIWPQVLPATPAKVSLDVESAALEGPLVVGTDFSAVGGRYVRLAESPRPVSPGRAGVAEIPFQIRDPGLYSLWARTISRSDDQTSLWIRVDRGEWHRWADVPRSDAWQWAMVEDSDNARQILQFELQPGEHVLEVAGGAGGLLLDQLVLSNDPLYDPEREI